MNSFKWLRKTRLSTVKGNLTRGLHYKLKMSVGVEGIWWAMALVYISSRRLSPDMTDGLRKAFQLR